jgi:16S rRNA (cytosine967-C5)-methyltransferase
LAASAAFRDGLVELQDASSQAVCAGLPSARRMLDYCAGGGGKVLAYGDAHDTALFAHDANPGRLRDLPERAARAGLKVRLLDQKGCRKAAPFDLVLADVPCSGSGSWRRAPEGKWSLTPEKLEDLIALQAQILDEAASLVAPGGCLAFATCSVLREENEDQVAAFVARSPGFALSYQERFEISEAGDGFFAAHLTRAG